MMQRLMITALAGALVLGASPAPAAAQFGKLKDIAKRKAAEATVDKAVDKATGADSAKAAAPAAGAAGARGGRAARTAPSTSNAATSQLEITGERLDQFLVALQPAIDAAQARAAERAQHIEYEASSQKFNACVQRIGSDASNVQPVDDPAANARIQKRLEQINAELQKEVAKPYAQQDTAKVARINVELADIMWEQQTLMIPKLKSCGKRPVEPKAVASGLRPQTPVAPAAKAAFTPIQFGIFRERVAAWTLTKGASGGGNGNTYSPSETAALQSRASKLATLEPYFRDGTLQWTSWGDLPDDWK